MRLHQAACRVQCKLFSTCTQVPTFLGKRWREACETSNKTGSRPELGFMEEVAGVQVLGTLRGSKATALHPYDRLGVLL